MHRGFLFSYLSLGLLLTNCGPAPNIKHPRGKTSRDNWMISGQIANDDYDGGEVLALSLDGMRYRSRVDEKQNFAIQLPGNASYALYFVSAAERGFEPPVDNDDTAAIAKASPRTAQHAILTFEESPDIGIRNTIRLPKVIFYNSINLGQIDIKSGLAYPTINPSQKLDFDYDGVSDFGDLDDQNDGLADLEQQQASERIEICPLNGKSPGKSVTISLSELYSHVENGADLGPCVGKFDDTPINASHHDSEVAQPNKPKEALKAKEPEKAAEPALPVDDGGKKETDESSDKDAGNEKVKDDKGAETKKPDDKEDEAEEEDGEENENTEEDVVTKPTGKNKFKRAPFKKRPQIRYFTY